MFICSDIYIILDFIVNRGSIMYEFLLKILYILNSDIRRDIFIGVTGLMVAIIIFIAEVISNKKYELEKRVILSKTAIIKNMKLCISIYFIMFISSIVKCSYDSPKEYFYIQNDALFIILQLLINALILVFMYKTFITFKTAVKLNINKEFFNNELEIYVNRRSFEIDIEIRKERLKNVEKLKQNFENYLKKSNKLSDNIFVFESSNQSYIPIYTNKRGIIKDYNYEKIDSMLANIDDISNEEPKDYLPDKESVFVFAKQIGDKVEKNSIVGYCLKVYKNYFKDFSNCIIYDENSMYIGDEIKLINENLFKFANNFADPNDFDDNDSLFNYFNYLYQNDLNEVRQFSISQLKETAGNVYKDQYKNFKYTIFLNRVLSLAYCHNQLDEYQQISKIILFLYCQQLKNDNNDTKQVAYNFANCYFKYDYFSIKKNNDIRFYDELMANLLGFICALIKEKNFDTINILFKNILLDRSDFINDDLVEKDILNLQFATGIIQCLYMLVDNGDISNEDKKEITNIINWTKEYFINTYDAWQIIINFKKYFSRKSSIRDVYRLLDFDDHTYESSWLMRGIDERIILKELLCAFDFSTVFEDNVDYDEITKDDKYYFQELLKLISDAKKTNFEQELNLDFIDGNLVESLKLVIADAEKKETEYIKNNQLDENKMKDFEKIIKEKVFVSSKLDDYLNNLNKIEKINLKMKGVCGINQLIPRDIFFENYGGYETFIEPFVKSLKKAKEREFIKKIDRFAKMSQDNVGSVLNKIEKPDDYLLITNYINCNNISDYDGYSNFILINGKKLDIMKFSQLDHIYLIEKRYLPKLQYCEFDDSFNEKNIEGNLYYELNDCSDDYQLRAQIIEKSSWLSEKGNIEEQHEYLKQCCRLKLFLAFRFYKIRNSKALKFNVKES